PLRPLRLCVEICSCLLTARLLQMPSELVAHRREQLVLEVRFTAGAEALVEGCGEDGRGLRLVDSSLDRPTAFAGVGHAATKLRQRWIFQQGARRQVQQPGGNYTSTPPYFGDIGKIEIVLIVLR